MKGRLQARFFQQLVVQNDRHYYPIPGTKRFRPIYDIGAEWVREMPRSSRETVQEIEEFLQSLGLTYHVEKLTWKEAVDFCHFECQQDHFVIQKKK